jgi:hypothetical protein
MPIIDINLLQGMKTISDYGKQFAIILIGKVFDKIISGK